MPIELSKTLLGKLPLSEREGAEEALWVKSGGICFLCEEEMNRSSDKIQADHDVPESEGGKNELANLNLAHDWCNKAKRAAKTVPVRPYLKVSAYAKKKGGRLKYDGYVDHFGITPKAIVASRAGHLVTFELPDGTKTQVPVMSESNAQGLFEYAFLQLPRAAIFNDDACQPRTIRLDHVWSIYSDLQRNVLHEPPSCRFEEYVLEKPVKLLMFDGQHKTVASWMLGREVVTSKVYLNMSSHQAIELVNSIQAKIRKLPLSPFELAGKMSDEWSNKFEQYEQLAGSTEVSEDGFLKSLEVGQERNRGKQALQAALVQNILDSPNLRILSHVTVPGAPAPLVPISENALKTKVIEKLLYLSPLTEKGESAQAVRDSEAATIVACLNTLTDSALEPADDSAGYTAIELERGKRLAYQAALEYASSLIKQLWSHVTMKTGVNMPMAATLTADQEAQLTLGITRIAQHPAWTAQWTRDEKMAKLKTSLEKNQEVKASLEAVGLDLPYLLLGSASPSYGAYWQ